MGVRFPHCLAGVPLVLSTGRAKGPAAPGDRPIIQAAHLGQPEAHPKAHFSPDVNQVQAGNRAKSMIPGSFGFHAALQIISSPGRTIERRGVVAMRVETNLASCDGALAGHPNMREPHPLPTKSGCEQVRSYVWFINSVTWQDGQHNSTERAKSGGRCIFYVRKDFQFELHSARKL
jgi:hypothetical protein